MHDAQQNSKKGAEYHLNQYQQNAPRFSLYEIGHYLKRYTKKMRKAHGGRFHKIIWFKKGRGRYFAHYKGHDITEGAVFFIKSGSNDYFDKNTHYQGILMCFNDAFLSAQTQDGFTAGYDLFHNKERPCCSLSSADAAVLEQYMDLIKTELSDKNPAEEILKAYVRVFLIQIQHLTARQQKTGRWAAGGDKKQLKLAEFVKLIEDHYTENLAVSQYARLLGVSPRTLCGLTKKTAEKTPSQLIDEKIILEAQKLLLETDLSIKKTAVRLGFKEPSYFVKYFKSHTGMLPSDFKKS